MVIAASAGLRQGAIVGAVLLACWTVPAAAAQCSGQGSEAPVVRLKVETLAPIYRNSLTRKQIGALDGHGTFGDRTHAGLTQSRTAFSVRPNVRFVPLETGRYCALLVEVDASWRLTQLLVDIASEYPPGTCPYREVRSHEDQHVAIALRQFAAAERALRARLADLAQREVGAVVTGSPDRAAQAVAARLLAGAQETLTQYQRDAQRANAAIDTPENYRAVSARCADW